MCPDVLLNVSLHPYTQSCVSPSNEPAERGQLIFTVNNLQVVATDSLFDTPSHNNISAHSSHRPSDR